MVNYYPEKPDVAYRKTQVEMSLVISYLQKAIAPVEHKRSAYIMFRNESTNGKSGVNNNYAGIQADSGRWPAIYDDRITGVVTKTENGTGKIRLFCAFADYTASLDFLLERVKARGLYVGGTTHKITNVYVDSPETLALTYKREWVTGNPKANFVVDQNGESAELNNFLSMYRQAAKLFV
jgi:hypothetical protein